MHEEVTESVFYQRGYDKGFSEALENLAKDFNGAYEKGFAKGWQKNEYQNKWVSIEDEVPEIGRRLLYYFDMCGVFLGFYIGRDEEYPSENDHIFASNVGFLTGDVTHWQYMGEYPEGNEELVKSDLEYCESLAKDVNKVKEPIGGDK